MITHRKRQQLIFFFLGFFFGLVVAIVVGYFGVIKQFTQNQIEKINILNNQDTVFLSAPPQNITAKKKNTNPTKDSLSILNTQEDTLLINEIQTDRFISSIVLSIENTDTLADKSNYFPQEILVEQWENPMHFIGYQLNKEKLVIYGVDIEQITLTTNNEKLFLWIANNKIALEYTDDFLHFPNQVFQNELNNNNNE